MIDSCQALAFAEPREADEPRLVLSGGCAVHAGQLLDLSWTAADSVSELEILVSFDGGRHYSQCISPELDPSCRGFRWRVPDVQASEIRLRIRYNRGGREIEGAPTTTMSVSGTGGAEPLGLPPPGGESESRTPGGSRSPSTTVMSGAMEEPGRRDDRFRDVARCRKSSEHSYWYVCANRPAPQRDRFPRFIPLRA